jgi:hypothetical protein
LELLADWFERAITAYGQGSIRATARVAQLDERPLYSLVNAERLLPLPLVRALAAGLEQDLGEAEQLWSEAKRQLEQAADKRRRERQPTVGGWADIGHPEPALRDLLEAQSSLLDCLPYRQLGLVEPLLSAVFVNQAVRHLPPDPELEGPESAAAEGRLPVPANEAPTTPTATASTRSSALQRETGRSEDVPPVNLAEALNQHESLLVIGDPGSGKSTLANQLGHRLAQLWLRETAVHKAPLVEVVVPLRLPATLLADEEGPWSETVRNTVRRSLGRGLVSEPSASLFSGRVAGARWLLFVDGLDEIADVNQRTDLIRTLAGHTRPGGAFRFVITTRPLSNSELAPLRAATVGCYEMQPFDRDQLAAYARRWFEQQPRHTPDAERSSKRFLDDTKGGALQELVKNPLLATIALVQATLRPAQPLPTSLIALYRSFIEILRRNRLPAPAGQNGPTTPSWVVDILDHLLATLAQRQVEGNEDHLGDIEPLVRSALGELRPLPTDWQQTVTSAVNQSGIVVITGDRIRFTHHSFAEFLTSRLQAEAVGDDEQLLERWIWQAGDSAQRSLARFTLWHWAEGPVGSPERLVAKVLSFPGVESTLHAASLLAEGLNAMPQQVAEVCTRLCGIVRMAAPNSPPTEAAGLLAALVWRYPTAQLLEGLVRNTFLPATVRYQALEALSRSCPAELSTSLLDLLLEHLYEVLPEAAALSLTLNASAPHRVSQRLGDMLAEVDADEWEWTAAAEGYRALGDLSEAAEQARRVLEQPTAAVAYRRRAAKTWLALGEITQQADSLTAIAWAGDSSDHAGRLVFAQELADAGATDAAGKLLLTLLTCDDAQDQHEVAAGLWLRLDNARAVQPVAELFERLQALGADVWQLARLVELLGATHPGLPGVEWCRMTLPSASPWPVGGVDVLQAWASLAGPDCWDELSALVADQGCCKVEFQA